MPIRYFIPLREQNIIYFSPPLRLRFDICSLPPHNGGGYGEHGGECQNDTRASRGTKCRGYGEVTTYI